MTKGQKTTNGWTSAIRWIARILALASVGLFAAFFAMSGTKTISALSWGSLQGIPLLIALVVAILGVLIAWRWEMIGGLMSIAGAIAIMALVCAGSGTDMLFCSVLFTLPLLAAGALYLGCCWRKQVISRRA